MASSLRERERTKGKHKSFQKRERERGGGKDVTASHLFLFFKFPNAENHLRLGKHLNGRGIINRRRLCRSLWEDVGGWRRREIWAEPSWKSEQPSLHLLARINSRAPPRHYPRQTVQSFLLFPAHSVDFFFCQMHMWHKSPQHAKHSVWCIRVCMLEAQD